MKKLIGSILLGSSLIFNICNAEVLPARTLTITIEIPYIIDEEIPKVISDIKSTYKAPEAKVTIKESSYFDLTVWKFSTKPLEYSYTNGWGYYDPNVKLFKFERK